MPPRTAGRPPERAFLAFVTHDMRDPLNAVLGMARLLAETPLDEEQKSYVAAIEAAGETLLTLVNDLLDLSRLEAGRLELAAVDFDLEAFLDSLTTMLRPAAERRGLRLEHRLDGSVPTRLRGDPARLRQVLLNLAGNAVKYADRGTVRLEVGAEPAAGATARLRLRILDEGPGMSAETLERLFEPWARGVDEAAPGPSGSGLGMLLARRMIEHMGGSLEVTSAPGRGTCFEVRLVLERGARRPDAPHGAATLEGLAVLLVDPHRRTRVRNEGLLRGRGLQVNVAGEAAEALTTLSAAPALPDIVIVDGDAETRPFGGFARELRRLAGGERLRLVLLSAAGMRGDAERARESGYDAFLPKPVSPEDLEACLLTLAAGRPASLVTRHEIGGAASRPLTVLVADDNPTNLRLLSILLGRLGHRVLEAADGRQALELFENAQVDLVLLDVLMPGLDGLETVARIRAHPDPRRAATPVIAVTANALPEDTRRYRAAGMDDCLAKPIDPGAVRRLLAACPRRG